MGGVRLAYGIRLAHGPRRVGEPAPGILPPYQNGCLADHVHGVGGR